MSFSLLDLHIFKLVRAREAQKEEEKKQNASISREILERENSISHWILIRLRNNCQSFRFRMPSKRLGSKLGFQEKILTKCNDPLVRKIVEWRFNGRKYIGRVGVVFYTFDLEMEDLQTSFESCITNEVKRISSNG